ncbi:ATP-grasp fold amidoligase family protein [Pseudoalteromonas gelatinilytica]
MPSLQYKIFSSLLSKLPLYLRIQILYYRRFRRLCNFSSPQCFTEKLQVKKVTDRDNLLTVAADKIASKLFVKELVDDIYIPKTLWSASSAEEIDYLNLENLPVDYVYKANHTSQTIEIIKDSKHLSKSKMKALAKVWLKHDQSGSLGEWAYENIEPKVFIEEFLDFGGKEPDDYKLFVYHGKVHFIQLDSDRFLNHKRNMFDRDWEELGFSFSHSRKLPIPPKPPFLEGMIEIAERIGANFDFIRVDLYWYNSQITFGELTVYPGAGFEKFPSIEWDRKFGEPWKI